MSNRGNRVPTTTTILAAILLLTMALPAAAAQSGQIQGQPDIQGIWQAFGNTASDNIEPHIATQGVPASVGVVVSTEDGLIPYRPEALARRDENSANREELDRVNRCYKPGIPRLTYMPFPFQIVQTQGRVMMYFEWIHNTRTVNLDRDEHLEGMLFRNGDSIGRWDGDTLEVTVGNFLEDAWFDATGNWHSANAEIVERYTREGPDHMTYEVTVDDPEVYTEPWSMRMTLYRRVEDNFRLLEYECHYYRDQELELGIFAQ